MSELTFDVGLAAKLKQAVIRNGITNLADIDWLCEGNNLAKVRRLRQKHVLFMPEHPIDCDADPFNPGSKDGWTVKEHKKDGLLDLDSKQIVFFLASERKNGKQIKGSNLRKELAEKPVMNANVLDHLLSHQKLIPGGWKSRCVLFWGTVYHSVNIGLCVRYLGWNGTTWYSGFYWLDTDWRDDYLVALYIG